MDDKDDIVSNGLDYMVDKGTSDPYGVVKAATAMQEQPRKNLNPYVKDLVSKDISDRSELGRERYGVYLQANNGRDTLVDAYQEVLDLAMYLRSLLYERDKK